MSRQFRTTWAVFLSCLMFMTGCLPSTRFYFLEDGDLSHYMDVATEIEEPDVDFCTLEEVKYAQHPFTLEDFDRGEFWDLTLEEAVHITLANAKTIRRLGLLPTPGQAQSIVQTRVESISRSGSAAVGTVYDPAIQESNVVTNNFGSQGVESALSAFDAQLSASMLWENNERPVNVGGIGQAIFARNFEQDRATWQAQVSKFTAVGSQFFARNNVIYDQNNNPTRAVPSDYNLNFEAGFSQPLLQGAGALFTRINGPSDANRTSLGSNRGVAIARVNQDIALTQFEENVRDMVADVETAYWSLWFAYRQLETQRTGRDSALQNWRTTKAKYEVGAEGGDAATEAQARSEYFRFRGLVEQSLRDLYRTEARLRYLMGLASTDGRIIRPADEPTTAKVDFDWYNIHEEALVRSVDIRNQKWRIEQRELELIAARNWLLPRLDATGTYRWLGAGDDLIGQGRGVPPFEGSNAFATLTSGAYQEWNLGLTFNMPLGFRRELAGVRNAQLQLARERAVLQDVELEVSHQVAEALRNLEFNYALAATRFNNWASTTEEVTAVTAAYETGTVTYNDLLAAFARRADAESAYYSALADYNLSITEVHLRKGSLLEYNGVYLAEGPWPCKAYTDATMRARERDAAAFIDYGFTRPSVFSRGVFPQFFGPQTSGQEGGDGKTPEEVPPPQADGGNGTTPSILDEEKLPADAISLPYGSSAMNSPERNGFPSERKVPVRAVSHSGLETLNYGQAGLGQPNARAVAYEARASAATPATR